MIELLVIGGALFVYLTWRHERDTNAKVAQYHVDKNGVQWVTGGAIEIGTDLFTYSARPVTGYAVVPEELRRVGAPTRDTLIGAIEAFALLHSKEV